MKSIVLANQKGGVGKSALATQLAHYAHSIGLRVLVIDLDHQRNTSRPLTSHSTVTTTSFSSADLLNGNAIAQGQEHRFVLVAGDDRLTGLEKQADNHNRFATNLRTFLSSRAGNFDLCVIDTNPNPDIRYASALISADYALAPVQLNQEAIEGIAGLLAHPRYGLSKIKAALNPKLHFLGILPNMVEPTPFQRRNMTLLTEKFGNRLLSDDRAGSPKYAFVPKRSAIAEAQAAGMFLPELKKTSARDACNELRPVLDTILYRMGLHLHEEANQ
ncbi:ParA family protein [Asticcacaulis tiandongensis]|uniref:ParA family protein n=1 Tax=Asticcacaulis tiandongensis TaxID=2565365 RepID=UPI001128F5A1|nr:ParA family protein [Asticcacaulis tiandongensis]